MRIFTLILGMALSIAACAQDGALDRFQVDVHYKLLPAAVATITPGKIEVTEAFSYGCGHCYSFEPLLLAWQSKLADDVEVVKLPVIWKPSMQPMARVLYTGKALGIADDVNARVFAAIHNERKRLASETEIAELFKGLGVDEEKFKKTFNSFAVSSQVQQAEARTRSMQITATPQIIVDGRYSISATQDLGHDGMLQVADFLIEKVRAEKGKK